MERGTGNREQGNGKRGTQHGMERGTNRVRRMELRIGAGIGMGTGNRERMMKLGTRDREYGISGGNGTKQENEKEMKRGNKEW